MCVVNMPYRAPLTRPTCIGKEEQEEKGRKEGSKMKIRRKKDGEGRKEGRRKRRKIGWKMKEAKDGGGKWRK
jgi:hypothetical protein